MGDSSVERCLYRNLPRHERDYTSIRLLLSMHRGNGPTAHPASCGGAQDRPLSTRDCREARCLGERGRDRTQERALLADRSWAARATVTSNDTP